MHTTSTTSTAALTATATYSKTAYLAAKRLAKRLAKNKLDTCGYQMSPSQQRAFALFRSAEGALLALLRSRCAVEYSWANEYRLEHALGNARAAFFKCCPVAVHFRGL